MWLVCFVEGVRVKVYLDSGVFIGIILLFKVLGYVFGKEVDE